MTEELRTTGIISLVFYGLIILHKFVYHYFNDPAFIVQMLFFVSILFTTAVLEGVFRSNNKKLQC